MLELAEDEATLPLERAKFLAIFATNLDEFFMVRVAGLKRAGRSTPAGRQPRRAVHPRSSWSASALTPRSWSRGTRSAGVIRCGPQLAEAGIRIVHWSDLGHRQREKLGDYFREQIFPVLTPLAVDPAHPFPYISGLSLNLAVMVRTGDSGDSGDRMDGAAPSERFARVKVPPNVPRLVRVGRASERTRPVTRTSRSCRSRS